MKAPLLLAFLFSVPASGQSIHLAGGQSTLLNAEGAGTTVYLSNQELYIGGGRGIGVSDKFNYDRLDFTLGDSIFAYSTEGAGASLFERGVRIEKKTEDRTIGAFAGLTGLTYQVPFFSSMQEARYPGIGVFYRRKYRNWKFSNLDLFSRQKTVIGSAAWDGAKLSFAANGGLVQNLWQTGATFIFKPIKDVNVYGAHVNQLNYQSDSLSAGLSEGWFQAQASFLRNKYLGRESDGESVGLMGMWRWIQVRSAFYSSDHHQSVVNSLTEQTRHWSLTQSLTNANQLQFGGAYHNNTFGVSFNHSVAFIPGAGFQQVVSVSLSFKIHDSQVNTAGYLLEKKYKYSAYADQWMQGPLASTGGGHGMQKRIGKFVVQGLVSKPDGAGVEGIAIRCNDEIVYTDSTGMWTYRSRKKVNLPVQIQVLPDESIAPGDFKIVDASNPLKIIVQQI